jgi:ribonuclease P protein component
LNDFSTDRLPRRSEGFSRDVRLNDSRDFNRVFRTATVRKGRGALRMSAVATRMQTARLGLVVGKRALRRAHDRNRAKRVLRETFRRRRESLPAMDIVILVTGDAGNRAYREALEALLSELQAN